VLNFANLKGYFIVITYIIFKSRKTFVKLLLNTTGTSQIMNINTKDIQAPIKNEMAAFEGKFREFMKSDVHLLDKIMSYIVQRKGKQLRPMFVFLTAGTCGPITERAYRGASFIELLHTATLVHDDVVDEAEKRRGFFSINAIWKNKIAVLVGDYLFSKGMLLSIDHEDFDLFRIVSRAVKEIVEGELLQLEKARKLDITENVYFDIIRQKTATLIAACCAVGAASAKASTEAIENARKFGELVGIAFQIKDDLFDYGTDEIGKPLGIDIKEKKMTLPLIFALNQVGWLEKRRIINIVKNETDKRLKVDQVIRFVKEKGGLSYAETKMKEFVKEAIIILHTFPESAHRTALEQLVYYTIERKK
jgi:octaprenyl-diphosphate synthase